ncbi:MAG: glycosyltransferase family 2 protein [Actinomycetota bacterium]
MSIVIATRNRSEMVKQALKAALGQTFPDLEVIVVDDGSDPPLQLEGTDPKVSVVRLPESRGVSAARNAGLAHAKGNWVMFLDDDDEIVPEMLEISLQAASRSELPPPVAVVSGIEIVKPDGSIQVVRLPASLPKGRDYFLEGAPKGRAFTVGNTLVIPRKLLVEIGGFDEELRSAVHSELFLRLNAACSIEAVPVVTYRIKRHGGEHVHDNAMARARAMEKTVSRHKEAFARHPRRYARYLCATGMWYLKAGEWGAAVRATTRALRIHPLSWNVLGSWLISLGGPPLVASYRWLFRRRGRLRQTSPVRTMRGIG